MTFNVLVTGGRDYADEATLNETLDELHARHAIFAIIHGGYRGADELAGKWADARGVYEVPIKALWDEYDKRAGPLRNKAMLHICKVSLVVAFPGGSGTAHMASQARKANIRVLDVRRRAA